MLRGVWFTCKLHTVQQLSCVHKEYVKNTSLNTKFLSNFLKIIQYGCSHIKQFSVSDNKLNTSKVMSLLQQSKHWQN